MFGGRPGPGGREGGANASVAHATWIRIPETETGRVLFQHSLVVLRSEYHGMLLEFEEPDLPLPHMFCHLGHTSLDFGFRFEQPQLAHPYFGQSLALLT